MSLPLEVFEFRSGSRQAGRLSVIGAVLVMLVGCAGTGPPAPQSGYRANVTVRTADGDTVTAGLERVVEFYSMGKRRRYARVDGQEIAVIDRPDLHVSWRLDPKDKSFEEYRISDDRAELSSAPNPFGPRSEAAFKKLGVEMRDGVETEKYAVEGEGVSGHAWFSVDRIPLRFEGRLGSNEMQVEYSEIERGSQAAFLFAIPPNYAGYEKRKQKVVQTRQELEDAVRALEKQKRKVRVVPTIF